MKKYITAVAVAALCVGSLSAQSALDAFAVSQTDMRGTAHFMSMAGAFTALGGDISTLNQNPAGIGVYRSSDISATIDVTASSTKTLTGSWSSTDFNFNNIGYVGAFSLGSQSVMPYFNWGFSYSRKASFDRRYKGGWNDLGTSLSNYVADYMQYEGWTPKQLDGFDIENYNPYLKISAPWLGILMYNTYGINTPTDNDEQADYKGLYNYGYSNGIAEYDIEEKGYMDEYSINFGGNISNLVYWGIGFGITDLQYRQNAYYGEYIKNADVPSADGNAITQGEASYGLNNWKHIYGNGFNLKVGVIVKPINELRIGLAVHTPTWYNLTYEGMAAVGYDYSSPSYLENPGFSSATVKDYTNFTDGGYLDVFDWKLRSPWRLMAGVTGVIGGRAIVSADYEYRAYPSMTVKSGNGNTYGMIGQDIKNYYEASHTLRLGVEYRLSNSWSARAGYSYESSPVKETAMNGDEVIYTAGADDTCAQPAFTLDRSTQLVTCGLGYNYKNFYADLAYVHRYRRSKYQAFTNYVENIDPKEFVMAPSDRLVLNDNSLVLTLGVRF
ncbi:MAG: outer membrane protein transport protein [Duncaniella sp.]|nr:outer membrane protein transport protein [Duncaniella sp.]